jgi:hypothetical protein
MNALAARLHIKRAGAWKIGKKEKTDEKGDTV